ncbi:hypothetical protein F4553_000383 [Allocatelliglobosispora scoriae]|uniref:Aminoglycoside phosphotransferase domain-containing protein n=1 Tax=Allocatelliglobosispora scoriae TaxID=643052 RepID=A0A841BFD5_9ACTN|nr:phosphotransferase [Allocatelliglobosispora scoriae]MBB5867004.1 hypothetical protein [Allocatelliglobosispora scoriae]
MDETEWALAQTWIAAALADRGTPATGPAVIDRDRPWSRVARVPVDGGEVWFKRNNEGSRYEAGLMRLLATLLPDHVIVPIAVDVPRGWMLLPDGGHTLRSLTGDVFHEDRWEVLLRRYAELQQAVAPRAEELLAMGVPDVRPRAVPEIFAQLLDDPYVVANTSAENLAALRAWEPRLAELAARLDASGIAPSVQHDDLHTGNVFADAEGGLRFFDFGDASLAHPFGTMLVALRVVHRDAKVEHDDPVLHRLRDHYLSAWGGEADLPELRRICQDAIEVTKVSKALSYHRSLIDADEQALTEYGDGITGWLEELLGPDVVSRP